MYSARLVLWLKSSEFDFIRGRTLIKSRLWALTFKLSLGLVILPFPCSWAALMCPITDDILQYIMFWKSSLIALKRFEILLRYTLNHLFAFSAMWRGFVWAWKWLKIFVRFLYCFLSCNLIEDDFFFFLRILFHCEISSIRPAALPVLMTLSLTLTDSRKILLQCCRVGCMSWTHWTVFSIYSSGGFTISSSFISV